MKRFLYYNQDAVNSFLAQIEQGLLVKESAGDEQTESISRTAGTESDLSGDLSAKVLGIGAAMKGNLHGNESGTEATSSLIRSVQEKVLHDYAFDSIYQHVMDNNLINNEDPKIGDIVLVTEVPTFLDFDYFEMLFSDNGVIKLTNEQNKKNMDAKLDQLKQLVSKGGPEATLAKQQMKTLKDTVNNAEAERKELARQMAVIRNILPYNRFVMTTNMLVPLDDENFRDNPNVIAFKYGGKISIFGYVTNVITTNEQISNGNRFMELYSTVNQTMLKLFNKKEKVFVVHPVALFY